MKPLDISVLESYMPATSDLLNYLDKIGTTKNISCLNGVLIIYNSSIIISPNKQVEIKILYNLKLKQHEWGLNAGWSCHHSPKGIMS